MLLSTLDTSLLGNMLSGKGIKRAGDGISRAGYGSKRPLVKKSLKKIFLIPSHLLINFEMQKYYQI